MSSINLSGRNRIAAALTILELIYHSTVRSIRQGHRYAIVAVIQSIMTQLIMVGAFYIMFSVLGLRSIAVRGDFVLFLLSGIMLFMVHIKSFSAVASAEGPTSAMMKHAPMTTAISLVSSALGALYIQSLAMVIILFFYNALAGPIYIFDPVSFAMMMLVAWFTGVCVGLVFLGLKPWMPAVMMIFKTVYMRANMICSGKMVLGNSLGGFALAMFEWNPLFHVIDQSRGYMFINYYPRNSSWEYAIYVGLVLMVIGLLLEFYTRRHASLSWGAMQ